MFVLRGLFVASLAGYWRLFPRRFLMAASSSDGEYSSAFVTCPNTDVAKKIARGLVQKKIAACVNIIPGITSVYTWEDKVEEDAEVLMMIKKNSQTVRHFLPAKFIPQLSFVFLRLCCCTFFVHCTDRPLCSSDLLFCKDI
ncbi:protein CutA homolog isoform X1 [Acropora palmata]|uniref:protein CutA homolog isoform X1 n=1 Tax=Acropora palmata TaxID=6131 RepID=UPI003D9FD4D0